MFCCCNNTESKGSEPEKTNYITFTKTGYRVNYDIIIIDSCEYLTYNPSSSTGMTFHKGNCKFCTARLKELLNKN